MSREAYQSAVILSDAEYKERDWKLPIVLVNGIPHNLRVRGRAETSCSLDFETGEMLCDYLRNPARLDCRQPWCRWSVQMRQRVVGRLRKKFLALSEKRRGGR